MIDNSFSGQLLLQLQSLNLMLLVMHLAELLQLTIRLSETNAQIPFVNLGNPLTTSLPQVRFIWNYGFQTWIVWFQTWIAWYQKWIAWFQTWNADFKHGVLDIKHGILDIKHGLLDFKHGLLDIKHGMLDFKHVFSS